MMRIIILFCAIQLSLSATIRFENEKNNAVYNLEETENDLVFSDVSEQNEVRDRLYRQLRQYGVPSDVAHMYVPRGMTVGDLLGKDKNSSNSDTQETDDSPSTFDPWSIVWYIGSFGGLIAFFLVISCSEWCCLKSRAAATLAGAPLSTPRAHRCPPNTTRPSTVADTPPPGYHLFAPPSYDLVFGEKQKYDVFVVPIHSVTHVRQGCLENPPSYHEITI